MDIAFRKGMEKDLYQLMEIIKDTIQVMSENGNDQWTDEYPSEEHFLSDIKDNTLFVAVNEKDIPVGTVTIDKKAPAAYKEIDWRKDEEAFYIHRIAVDIHVRGQGIASKLLSFSDQFAKEQNIYYLRTDTYSLNEKAQKLFVKNGYVEVGMISAEASYLGKSRPFHAYDKILF
jgi:ribosomal protein S18 acetylase RimI-like enzyme